MSAMLKRHACRYCLWVLVASIYLVPLLIVRGAVDMFLKIEGVDGESADTDHKDWIIIESFSHEVSRSISGTGSNRVVGPSEHGELVVRKRIDKSSPILMRGACEGKVYPKVEFNIVRAAEGTTNTYLTYKLADVLVSSIAPSGSHGSGPIPTDQISLNYSKIEWSYHELNTVTREITNEVSATCDPDGTGVP